MQADLSHLHAIEDRLIRERSRLSVASSEGERALRAVWVVQAERELAAERQFLGLPSEEAVELMSDDALLAELAA